MPADSIVESAAPGQSGQKLDRLALIGISGARASDADAVISEGCVHVRDRDARHVAGDAIFPGDGASFAGMIHGYFLGGRKQMTRQAFLIIGGGFVD
jgi:hypothetical protein